MKLSTIQRVAERNNLYSEVFNLTNGKKGLFISLEHINEYGMAKQVPYKEYTPFIKYLDRYKIPYEYRGYYTSILIKEDSK